jgi:hypothetical protein
MTRHVISAPPTLDVAAFARTLGKTQPYGDPSRALCAKYGYQTLYEMPVALQKRVRLEVIESHAQVLAADANAICDHSVFVWLADWMRWLWGATPSEEWERVLAAAAPAAQRSEAIHHVVDGPRAAYDGYRWLDARNAAQLDPLVRLLYREFGCEPRVRDVTLPR